MTDDFGNVSGGILAPIAGAVAVAPSDATDLDKTTRGLYVGTAGNVKTTLKSGDVVTFKNLAAGIVHPIRVSRVWATGTTAADVVGVY